MNVSKEKAELVKNKDVFREIKTVKLPEHLEKFKKERERKIRVYQKFAQLECNKKEESGLDGISLWELDNIELSNMIAEYEDMFGKYRKKKING